MVRDTEVIHVDNVYNYYSKTDKQNLYYLKVLVRSLLD
jgi:RNA binding exosome subunit